MKIITLKGKKDKSKDNLERIKDIYEYQKTVFNLKIQMEN